MRRVVKVLGVALAAAALLGTDVAAGQAAAPSAAGDQPEQSQAQAQDEDARRPLIQVRRPPILPVPESEVITDEPGAGPQLGEENQTPVLQWNGVRVSAGPVVIQFPDLTTNDGTEEVPTPGLLVRMPWTVP